MKTRTFTHVDKFGDNTAYIEINETPPNYVVQKDGKRVEFFTDLEWCLRFVAEGKWKETTISYFLHMDGAFGPDSCRYYVRKTGDKFEYVYTDGTTGPLHVDNSYKEFVADGRWKEVTKEQAEAALLPKKELKATEAAADCFLVVRKFSDGSLALSDHFATLEEAGSFALDEVKKLKSRTSTIIFKPVKSFTLVQAAPTIKIVDL